MRPLNIKISGFGPYAGCVEINFDELGERGLYLITGDTGAGKTTIFDAICFALFGEASGNNRDVTMLRSMYAAPSTPTEVDLLFSHAGKEYRVRRNPEYMRPKNRGEGMTKCLADAELDLPDGRVITKSKQVTAEIVSLLGIDRDQFSQIVMLAQGDFLKLLFAETKDRIEIFRNIFKTRYYQDLQNKIEAGRKTVYGQVEDGRKSVSQFIGGIMVDDDDVLSMDVDKAKNDMMTLEDVISLLDKLIESDEAQKKKLDKELGDINKKLEEVNNRIGVAETLEKAERNKKEAEEELKQEEQMLPEMENELKAAENTLKDKTKLESEAVKLESKLPDYDKVDELVRELNDLTAKNEKNGRELKKYNEELAEKVAESEKLKKEQDSIKNSGEELERLNSQFNKINESINELEELEESLEGYSEECEKLEQSQENYKNVDAAFRNENMKYELMEQTFMDAQAGILAERLEDGMPCPVCGSKEHPNKAKLCDDVPTETQLKNAKKSAETARKGREDASKAVEGCKKTVETVKKSILKKIDEQLKTDDIEKASELITDKKDKDEKELSVINEKIKTEKKNKARKEELENLIPKLDGEISGLNEKIANGNSAKASNEAKITEMTRQLQEVKKGLSFGSKKEAKAECDSLLKKANDIQLKYDKAQKAFNSKKTHIAELKAKIESQMKTISQSVECDLEKERELQTELKSEQNKCVKDGQSVGTRIETNKTLKENIIRKSGEISDLEKKLMWMTTLANTANGRLNGKDKIMLETYIQTMYFDRIIQRANLRLLTMSGGQYELTRMKEAVNGSKQSGLDLNVIDHSNGTERSVKSLSGGESFMASLSLALGLSDEVQSSAGGIKVDTMFVDEGFGSLDPDSLDMAYKALIGLTESNRLVGIISHVTDLKNRIDKQVVVTKSKAGGSKVEVIV